MNKIYILIIIIVTTFGCNNQKIKNETKVNSNSITEKNIDTTSDNELASLIYFNLSDQVSKDYENELKTVLSWNKYKQTIYIIWLLEAEVNNGGFNQFYFNSSGQFYKFVPNAFKNIGALKFAELTEKANQIYINENKKITKELDGTIEGFSKSYKDNPLNELDDEFFNLYEIEDIQQLQANFIRKYKKEFLK